MQHELDLPDTRKLRSGKVQGGKWWIFRLLEEDPGQPGVGAPGRGENGQSDYPAADPLCFLSVVSLGLWIGILGPGMAEVT